MSKKNFINKSYKDKLRATYTLFTFLILILLSVFLYFGMNNKVKPIIGDIGVHVIDSEAQYFGQRFNNQRDMLELLASTEAFKTADISAIKKEIDNQMHRYEKLIISMKFKSINGKEYENNPKNIIISDIYEHELLSGDKSSLISQTTYAENISEYISYIGTKVTDSNGEVQGILIISAEVKKIILSVDKTKINQLDEMWILDSDANVIIDPNKKQMEIYDVEGFKKQISNKTSGEVEITSPKGNSSYLVYSKIPNTEGLYLATGIDHKDFLAAMKFLMYIVLSGAILACIIIFGFANKISSFVTKPLTRMVEIIQNSDGTNFIEIPKDLKASKDEIGILANTIDEMARNIRSNVHDLNSEIKERQKAEENLIVLNNELEGRVKQRTLALTKVTHSLSISEDRFRVALEAAHIGLYDSECAYNGLVVNGVFLKLINADEYKKGRVKDSDWVKYNHKLVDVVCDEDVPKMILLGENNLQHKPKDFYEEFRLKEDSNTWLSLTGKVVKKDKDGKVIRFIGVLQNISQRKRTEVELKKAKEEAEEASLSKSQFLANMSHEIRTPMNAIMGLTHLIGQSKLDDSQTKYVSKIQGSSNILLRIINDILDFSKIEANKMEIEHIKFNLDKVLENISNLYAISATNKGIDINFDTAEDVPDILIGDPLRLEQIICNLTTNAIKFTKHGEVNVSVRAINETENKVKLHFSITDTGIGLTKEQIEKLFKAFTQADGSMTRKYGGTGLGLAISKQLVELMSGKIWVESEYGEGASFQFIIEFDKYIDKLKLNNFDSPDLKGKRVLVVDHNETSLLILKRMLNSFSLEVTDLRNPYDVIELFKKENFDLLIIDFNLPELSGIDLYKRLLANSNIKVPKTIFVSAIGRETYYNQVKQLGAEIFLVKPINQSLLFDAIINALKEKTRARAFKDDSEEEKKQYKSILIDKNILVVEDNEINQLVAKDILEGAGSRVSIASNGYEAIKCVRSNKFDIVLMDVQMPIMDGYEATEILRKTYSSSQLPIIAMTANAMSGDREISIKSGMNDYISKPINPDTLFGILVKWLNGKSLNTNKEPLNTEIQVLDVKNTLHRFGDKQDFYKNLLNIYSKNYCNAPQELSDLMRDRKYDDIKRFIHSLKSVTGNIGAKRFNNYIIEFEKKYDAYDNEEIIESLKNFSDLNEELLMAIAKVSSIDNLEEKFLSKNRYFCEALEKFVVVLSKSRAKEIKESMNCLITSIHDDELMAKINEIKKLVDRYHFKEAKIMVEKLIDVQRGSNNE